MRIFLCGLTVLAVLSLCICPSLADEEIQPSGSLEEAIARAQAAVAESNMTFTISTVGFDLAPGSDAERHLQEISQIGGGAYFAAADDGSLSQAVAGAALGQSSGYGEMPIVTSPRNGDTVGPSTMVTGKVSPGAFVVLHTEVYDEVTGEFVKKVPGHRHRADDSGNFALLIATPLVSFGEKHALRYEIHAFTARPDGWKSAHAIVTVHQQTNQNP